ncbi:MAG TPA: helix-turn-helix domain-containing protein [Streptosporangiaceae bacterium]
MRYPDGGGLTAAGRARRESVRLQAARMYEHDVSPVQVAHRLRVSTKSAYQWRRRWRAGGETALMSKGSGGAMCHLGAGQLGRLRAALEGGPAAWGWGRTGGGRWPGSRR